MGKPRKVIILGAGGHAQVVADIIIAMKEKGELIEIVGFLDDASDLWGREIKGFPVLGPISEIDSFEYDFVVVAIGDNDVRKRITKMLDMMGANFFKAIHPFSIIAPDVVIGDGTTICAGVVVNTGSVIGRGVILNTSCSVDHHCVVGDFTHIAPGAHLGGEVKVGKGVLVGIGSSVLPRVTIGDEAIIGAGAVVVKNIPSMAKVVGVPGRIIGFRR